jgi:hypothetical protein
MSLVRSRVRPERPGCSGPSCSSTAGPAPRSTVRTRAASRLLTRFLTGSLVLVGTGWRWTGRAFPKRERRWVSLALDVTRWDGGSPAHNPKVVGSNPTPATIEAAGQRPRRVRGLLPSQLDFYRIFGGICAGASTEQPDVVPSGPFWGTVALSWTGPRRTPTRSTALQIVRASSVNAISMRRW